MNDCTQHLQSLRDYFTEGGVDPTLSDCDTYCGLVTTLELNSLSSQDLMLKYYNDLINDLVGYSLGII